jgi:hypothetical protein
VSPDFSIKTVDTLAKRAAYKCSNPDCRVNTVGPNSDPEKSTKIGEAAHIYGARIGSKRFNPDMTDSARAEITNSIWLCRNCHRLIDTDEVKYSATVLFAWREKHEGYIASTLGNSTDQIIYEENTFILDDFKEYPPIIKRIILDKPDGWEWRLTAELMRFFNNPLFRKLKDLKEGLYLKCVTTIDSDKAFAWIQDRLEEMSRIATPASGLLDRLTQSWGKPGEPGDIKEIHHVTKLIRDYLEHVILFEEKIHFVNVPEDYQRLVSLLKDLIGSQVVKLSSIPSDLDEIVTLALEYKDKNNESKEIYKQYVFELPQNWEKGFNKELKNLKRHQGYGVNNTSGCLSTLIIIVIIVILFSLF